MANTSVNPFSLSSLSLPNRSCNVSATSRFAFQIPKKMIHFSRIHSKTTIFSHPIELHGLGYGFSHVGITAAGYCQKGFNFHVAPREKPGLGRDLVVVQATEAVEATAEEQAASQSKSSKKGKKLKYPRRILDLYQILQSPIITEAAIKNIAEENSLLFTVDVRADKKMIKDAVNNFFGVRVRKVNTLIRPDGTKKAYVMLSREYNASDIAKKIGIFPSSS